MDARRGGRRSSGSPYHPIIPAPAYSRAPPAKVQAAYLARPVTPASRAPARTTAGNSVTSTQIQLAGSRSFGDPPGRIDVKKPNTPQNTSRKNRLPTGAAPRAVV